MLDQFRVNASGDVELSNAFMRLTAVLGVILLVNDNAAASGTMQLRGIVFLLGGVLLAGIAFLRYRSQAAAPAA